MRSLYTLIFFLSISFSSIQATTWLIGPGHSHAKPSQVANLVQNGDTILIDAGIYPGDVARWTANNLVFKGVGGKAHLKSGGDVYGGKAIWVIVGDDVTVENIEFSEAACPDLNGAGIRSEGINLTVRNCFFHDNENGILAGDIASGDFLIEHCEFSGNGYDNGLAHNLYINHAHSLVFRFNYSHDARVGHELKSRAYTNIIYCNRLSDENGTASRNIDLPNGGFSIIMGNVIVQDPQSENSNLVGYGMEGLSNPNSELYVVYNTFVNNKGNGSFIQLGNGAQKLKAWNNIFAGPGTRISGNAVELDTAGNISGTVAEMNFTDPLNYDFHLQMGSPAVGLAQSSGMAGAYSLSPEDEYLHPVGSQNRASTIDAGAHANPVQSGTNTLSNSRYSVFPNPAIDQIQVGGLQGGETFFILDLHGWEIPGSIHLNRLDISGLSPGLYFLRIKSGLFQQTLPLLKH